MDGESGALNRRGSPVVYWLWQTAENRTRLRRPRPREALLFRRASGRPRRDGRRRKTCLRTHS